MKNPKKIYKDKKVLILGLGLNQGGLGAAKFFARSGAKVKVTDLKSAKQLKPSLKELKEFKNISYTLGEHKFEDIDWADLIIRNPKLLPNNKYLKYARKLNKQIEMDMGIFLQFAKPSQIIGVTGTKGKSTTSSLIYEIIRTDLKNVLFAGNIGKSVLDTIPFIKEKSLIVLELSSFQMEAFDEHKLSPKYSVITNIFPDHLDYYKSFKEYSNAKRLVAKNQKKGDFLFLCKDDEVTTSKKFLKGINSKIIYYSKNNLPANFNPKLKGLHNLENISVAVEVGKSLGIDEKKLLKRSAQFKGVEFRMQLIKVYKGIKIYNDTTATNPNSATHALNSFPNCILIAGGQDKGLEYKDFAKAIDEKTKEVYFLEGTATDKIQKGMAKRNKIKGVYNNLESLLKDVKKNLTSPILKKDLALHPKGGKLKQGGMDHPIEVVLFSPGATSFNLFHNEFDRGRKFNQAVIKVFR